eukprot:jgi/Antlo1/192/927
MDTESDTESQTSTQTLEENEPFIIEEEGDVVRIEADRRITSARMTKYEKAYVLGVRSAQLSMNAPPLVDIGEETDAFEIAVQELRERKIPFVIRRKLPDSTYEDWHIKEMIIPD